MVEARAWVSMETRALGPYPTRRGEPLVTCAGAPPAAAPASAIYPAAVRLAQAEVAILTSMSFVTPKPFPVPCFGRERRPPKGIRMGTPVQVQRLGSTSERGFGECRLSLSRTVAVLGPFLPRNHSSTKMVPVLSLATLTRNTTLTPPRLWRGIRVFEPPVLRHPGLGDALGVRYFHNKRWEGIWYVVESARHQSMVRLLGAAVGVDRVVSG